MSRSSSATSSSHLICECLCLCLCVCARARVCTCEYSRTHTKIKNRIIFFVPRMSEGYLYVHMWLFFREIFSQDARGCTRTYSWVHRWRLACYASFCALRPFFTRFFDIHLKAQLQAEVWHSASGRKASLTCSSFSPLYFSHHQLLL